MHDPVLGIGVAKCIDMPDNAIEMLESSSATRASWSFDVKMLATAIATMVLGSGGFSISNS